ncbi:hypothetical protein PAEPH01_0931 [Pancytospora epiphaga]|nr:hypothetical protein PAEPH01_0931 [Pancytospora epiphaga]
MSLHAGLFLSYTSFQIRVYLLIHCTFSSSWFPLLSICPGLLFPPQSRSLLIMNKDIRSIRINLYRRPYLSVYPDFYILIRDDLLYRVASHARVRFNSILCTQAQMYASYHLVMPSCVIVVQHHVALCNQVIYCLQPFFAMWTFRLLSSKHILPH